MLSKTDLRALIKQRGHELTAEQRAKQSATILNRLSHHPMFVQAHTILMFYSLPDEVDTHAFVRHWSCCKQLLLPVVVDDERLELRPYTSANEIRTGAYNIGEPTSSTFHHLEQIDLIIVPGVAFDAQGHRLGRGKGYYDRLLILPQLKHTYKIGICLPHQFMIYVPTNAHDVVMNEVMA